MDTALQKLIERSEEVESGSWEGVEYFGTCTCGAPFRFTEWRDTTPTYLDYDRVNYHQLDCNNCGKKLGGYDSCMYLDSQLV